jgi:hypothetical protein
MSMIALYALALAITLLVEVPVVAAFYPSQRVRMAVVAVVTIAAASVALDVVLARVTLRRDVAITVGQGVAFAIESAVYASAARGRERGWPRALAASAAANLASYLVELLFF